MRFQRQAKIFRGQLDAAPVAGVAFLLLIFMQLGSLLYTPGVLVHLNNPAATIRIAADGRLLFGTNFYTERETNQLRDALRNSAAGPPFDLEADSNTPPKVAALAREVVNSIFQIRPPAGPANLIGTDNPTVMVAVNFLGQYIYDNQIVGERELKAGFQERLRAAARESKELTLTVAADAQVNWDAVTRLAQWAREAGIKETVLAEWLDNPSAATAKPPP
jgi:biopolymer transport protein ExbD